MYTKSSELGYKISEGKILDCSERDLDYLRAIVYEDILREKPFRGAPVSLSFNQDTVVGNL